MGSSVDEAAARRQRDSLARWRLREREKDKLRAAKVEFTESGNSGIVHIRTTKGAVTYKLAPATWTANRPGTAKGKGVKALLAYMRGENA